MIQAGLVSLLSSDPTLRGLVGTRIYPILMPRNASTFPAIIYSDAAASTQPNLDLSALNVFLAQGASCLELHAHPSRELHIERVYSASTPEALLAPLAESAAELLAHADFDLIRQCEGQDCVLWYYDRTKAHRRRWCSMAICGNRAKVAAFRERQA